MPITLTITLTGGAGAAPVELTVVKKSDNATAGEKLMARVVRDSIVTGIDALAERKLVDVFTMPAGDSTN